MANDPNTSIPSPSAPVWQNWSGNLVHQPALDKANYYYTPTNITELQQVLVAAKTAGVTVRVSGQRHSQPPLVLEDNRGAVEQKAKTFVVDLSCYADLGNNHDQRIVLVPGKNQVTANAGVREDELDAFLSANKLMLQTVTAGGFFSLGGMTAVDVHGATIAAPIFAETVSSFTLLLADGTIMTIDEHTPKENGWSPLQFVRVSLGGLGIVTSMTIDVLERPQPTTLQGGSERLRLVDRSAFAEKFELLLGKHDRVETFFTPYAAAWPGFNNFLALYWDIVKNPAPETHSQSASASNNACVLAGKNPPEYGAPYLGGIAKYGAEYAQKSQYWGLPTDGAAEVTAYAAFEVIEPEVAAANLSHSELWLTGAVRVMFMSYYIPLPDLSAKSLGIVWDRLDEVTKIVTKYDKFHIAAPMEFRFIKSGNSAMSGTFSEAPGNSWFLNLDLIGFIEKDMASNYNKKLLQFFAEVEQAWVNKGGFPHNGKMYGFYKPEDNSTSAPFNPFFLSRLRKRRGPRLEAFNAYRKKLDPNGLFYNDYLRQLLE
ncbi:MAG: FAD-binding protein [Saprospiraceae bacterium]